MKTYIIFALLLLISPCAFSQQKQIPIHTIGDSTKFLQIIESIAAEEYALYVFDIDNTLLITNDNKFGSDWWFEQATKIDTTLKLKISDTCLFDVLSPLWYATLSTKPVFQTQPKAVNSLERRNSQTIALTARGFSSTVATATELELTKNAFDFPQKDSAYFQIPASKGSTKLKSVVMKNRIVYTAGGNKGYALLEYVRLQKKPYKKVYFFDDSQENVYNVKEAFQDSQEKFEMAIYHLKIAPKVYYSKLESKYMKMKLYNLLKIINHAACNCQAPACDD